MRAPTHTTPRILLALALLIASCSDAPRALRGTAAPSAPWQRTEEREPCADFEPLRRPLFGDIHIHTLFSADASIFGTKAGPRDAYAFARGEPIALSDENENPTRSAQIDRPLDFAAVTDHSEFFGEVDLCLDTDSPVYDIEMCRQLRQPDPPDGRFMVTVSWLYPAGIPNPPASHTFCDMPGIDCDASAASVWREMQAAAEEVYDRTSACTFTSFLGYEHTPSPLGRHQHRNVIFRNDHVPANVSSHLETYAGGFPQGLWDAIERDCLTAETGCDAILIPHNPNLSGGMQFIDPVDAADARRRQDREPLVEIYQHKGSSECRFDRLAGLGVGTEDELCTFEQREDAHEGPDEGPPPLELYPPRNLVRNALEEGLRFENALGTNPFRLGFIAGTDTHDATGGNVAEGDWDGAGGNSDATPARRIEGSLRQGPGGLAAVWAEENSRDSIFAALRRRETYATSGTRPMVRFFAGALEGVSCESGDLVERSYETGAPMGSEIGAVRGSASPRFAALAIKDPGDASHPGADLQRLQIVKGWVDASGVTHERVFDVATAPGAVSVDEATCTPRGSGARQLCALWEDPDFDASERAFYYVRMLEAPSCRWSTLLCKSEGIDPFSPDCAAQAEARNPDFAHCCLDEEADSFYEPIIQERAWTSPIWFQPDGISRVEGGLELGARSGALSLAVSIGRLPSHVDLTVDDLSVRLTDDDEIWALRIPAGAWEVRGENELVATVDAPSPTEASLQLAGDGSATLRFVASEVDLSHAPAGDQMVRLSLETGSLRTAHERLWRAGSDGRTLAPVPQ